MADTDLMAKRITETLVKSLISPSKGNQITYDTDLKGFGVRITAKGAKSFVLNYRVGGQERRLTIGSYPEWTAAAARKEVEGVKRRIDVGEDPMARRHEERAAATVADLCKLYEERHLPKKRPSSQRDDRSIIGKCIIPRFGKVKAAAIRYSDIEGLHRDLTLAAPYRANRTVALLSKIFSLAIKWELVVENPAKGIERNPEQPRARYLEIAELDRLLGVLSLHPHQQAANAVRLLLLTGARRSEVLSATWEQFDLDAGCWVKPAASVKQKRLHKVPLSLAAIELLRDMRAKANSECFLFPGKSSNAPITDIKKSWASICAKAQINGVRLHDLRHTYASHLASAGSSLPIIGALLGHTQAQTTQRYAHLFDDPLRTATEHVGALMSAASRKYRSTKHNGESD
jgi:integrase